MLLIIHFEYLRMVISLVFSCLSPLRRVARSHLELFANGFDPVKDVMPENVVLKQITDETYLPLGIGESSVKGQPNKVNYHFFSPIFIVGNYVIQGLIGFGSDQSFRNIDLNSKRFFTHKIFPQKVWRQSDLILAVSLAMIFVTYFHLSVYPMLEDKYFMWVCEANDARANFLIDSTGQEPKESSRILRLRRAFRRVINLSYVVWMFGANVYFTGTLVANSYLEATVSSIIYWLVIVPLFVSYGIFSNILLSLFLILTLKYIHIKQKSLLEQMSQLTKSFSSSARVSRNKYKSVLLWRQFIKLSSATVRLCHEIDGSNRFWCRYLSFICALYTCFICYSIYALFMVEAGVIEKSFFMLLFNFSTIFLFVLIKQCANVVRYNAQIDRHNSVCLCFFEANGHIRMNNMFKMDNIVQNQLSTKYGFRLQNNHLIDINTLHLTFYYITSFFMLNFSSQIDKK